MFNFWLPMQMEITYNPKSTNFCVFHMVLLRNWVCFSLHLKSGACAIPKRTELKLKSKQAGTTTGPSSGQAWICCNKAKLNKNTYQTNHTNPKPNPSKPKPTKPN